jgi:poly(3-hydroxybutyrate) depolymerase
MAFLWLGTVRQVACGNPGGTNHADVVFYTATGGGHTWPGGKPMAEFIVGKTTPDIDATRLMWGFFLEHPLAR